ncbi:putative phage tail protein [Paenibacillus shenyangensis]|uniref:putative phage tail protein n=1 Tax=Paenibacillus sp. A9 TaxID=1284352 RepID=UPI00035E950A|nr:putative phage tail protein [Paenibacillus sp. A9]
MNNRLMQYEPEYYHSIREFLALLNTEEIELDQLEANRLKLLADQFVMTSSEISLRRREQQLQIQADPTIETLNFRRRRIVNRYTTKPPFTIRYLQQKLDQLLGAGKANATVDIQNFALTVMANLTDASIFKEVNYTVQTIKPANMTYVQQTSLRESIMLRETAYRYSTERNTRLSTRWKLGSTPFTTLGEEIRIL